jgi:hypothetical protein
LLDGEALSNTATFDEALKSAVDWARKERPQELSEIYPDGRFVYNTQMAKRWLTLLQDWRKAVSLSSGKTVAEVNGGPEHLAWQTVETRRQ